MVPDPTPTQTDRTIERLVAVSYKLAMAADALALIAAGDDTVENMRALAGATLALVLRGWDAYPLLPDVLSDNDAATTFLAAATRP